MASYGSRYKRTSLSGTAVVGTIIGVILIAVLLSAIGAFIGGTILYGIFQIFNIATGVSYLQCVGIAWLFSIVTSAFTSVTVRNNN